MENNLIIEKMTTSDLNQIADILETDFDDFWNYNILKNELETESSYYCVCKINTEIIGFAGISIILDIAEINNVVVKKCYRGKGFSNFLLENLINIAKKSKCKTINLEVSSINTIAINLYKKYGFKQVGLRKKYYKNSDAFLLSKEIY